MNAVLFRFGALILLGSAMCPRPGLAADDLGYSTATRAEYVFACMATNGGTQDSLQRCSCAIDVIATLLPYEQVREGRDCAAHAAQCGWLPRSGVPQRNRQRNGS